MEIFMKISGVRALLFLFLIILVGFSAFITDQTKYQVKLKLSNYKEQMPILQQMEIDIAGVNIKNHEVGVVVTSEEIEKLKSKGFILHTKQWLGAKSLDEEYKNPTEIEQILKTYATEYQGLTDLVSIGKSDSGRDIWALKISNKNITSNFKKPTFYINGMHHAREVMSPEVPLDMIEYLLKNYGVDKKVTHWVDQNEIWAVPMLNVDGNNKVWNENTWWRKNTRDGHGVDVNRNYPYMWGQCKGSSGNKNADNYRGDSAGSELETQAVINLIKEIRPVTSLSLHSYSELVLYPYSCQNQHTPHRAFFEKTGKELAKQIPSDSGSGSYVAGTPWEILYSVDGGDIDWLYHDFNVLPFVIEMNQEFQVNYKQYRDKTVQKLRVMWMTLLDVLDAPGVRGRIKGFANQKIRIENISSQTKWKTYDYLTDNEGNFHIVLDPGKYRISSGANFSKIIDVGRTRVDLN